ncbi:uncharacterized protein RJT21DRAFT_54117 [Scheffersomyces amazonensis]|uniref:uncharacterized protein n=1 Tax=Scheffersomyces amazonensis TaxID=1078765 RepID=UPI00315CB307
MAEFINKVQLTETIRFLIVNYEQDNFNIFNSIIIDEHDPALLELNQNNGEVDFEKRKLGFMMSNFVAFCGWSNHRMIYLSEDYLSTDQYILDFRSLYDRVLETIDEVLVEMVRGSRISFSYVNSCFHISRIFFTSLARSRLEDGQLRNRRVNYSGSRRYFENYSQAFPSSIGLPGDNDLENKLMSLSLNVGMLKKTHFLTTEILKKVDSEAELKMQFESSFLDGLLRILSYKFDSADVTPEDTSSGIVRPDLGIRVTKAGSQFYVPIELKTSGLRGAIDSIANHNLPFMGPNAFREHFNQSIFQMLTYHSEIGFLIDRSSIIIIRIKSSKIVNQLVNQADGSLLKVLDCSVLCLEHSTNGNNLGSILISYLADYFQNITLQRTTAIEVLFRSFQLSEDQKRLRMVSRVDFVRGEWLNRFSNYQLVGNSFVHNSHPDISIAREIFELKDLIEEWRERNENEFEIVRNLRDGENINGHFSKVFLGRFRGTNSNIVLKIYDPMSAPILDRGIGLADRAFNSVFSYILEMFFSEIRAYLKIRGVPSGTDNSPPDSGSGNKSLKSLININYTPFLYDFGYFSGSMGSGFYLVEEFLVDEKLNCETEHFNTLAREALTKVHQIGLIHGDIHAANLIYERRRDRVFLIDFGKSSFTNLDEIQNNIETDWVDLERTLLQIRNMRFHLNH